MNKNKKTTTKTKIEKIIEKFNFTNARITQETNLYLDLGFDSLALVVFLTEIEKALNINIDIFEMEECLIIKNLLKICENKVKENNV